MQPNLGFFMSCFGNLSMNVLFFSLKNVNKSINGKFATDIWSGVTDICYTQS